MTTIHRLKEDEYVLVQLEFIVHGTQHQVTFHLFMLGFDLMTVHSIFERLDDQGFDDCLNLMSDFSDLTVRSAVN